MLENRIHRLSNLSISTLSVPRKKILRTCAIFRIQYNKCSETMQEIRIRSFLLLFF